MHAHRRCACMHAREYQDHFVSRLLTTMSQPHSRLRSRLRHSAALSRLTSATRRPSLRRRSLSASSLTKLLLTSTTVDSDSSIPTVSATIDNTLPLDFFKLDLVGVIKALKVSKWHKRQLIPAQLSVQRILGALTNSIYKLEYKDPVLNVNLPALLLRVYGKNVDLVVDRDTELEVLIKLLQKKIGPRLLGIFINGRIEQFLEGYVTLNRLQIRDAVISQMIARRMKDLHYKLELDDKDRKGIPATWKFILRWLDLFERTILPTWDNFDHREAFLTDYRKFRDAVLRYRKWLFDQYEEDISTNLRFCHNDTQYGNLLLHDLFSPEDIIVPQESSSLTSTTNKKDTNLAVIDFEYSGPNFPAYDLVNHFCEWMSDYHNEECSYYIHHDRYPTQLEQLNLIKSYVEYDFHYPSSNYKTNATVDVTSVTDILQYEIRKLYNECILWRPTVLIFWCLWGLIQNGPENDTTTDDLGSRKEEQGVGATYSISTGVDALQLDENVVVEDEITSSDDSFEYLKYAQQKASLMWGDLIGLGVVDELQVDQSMHHLIKHLDCGLFELAA